MLKKEQLEIRAMEKEQLLIEGAKEEIIEKIKKLEANNDKIVKMVEKIKKTGVKVLRNDKQQIENKLVLKEEKCCGNYQTQSPIAALQVNLLVGISSKEHKLCIHKRT